MLPNNLYLICSHLDLSVVGVDVGLVMTAGRASTIFNLESQGLSF